MKIVVVGASGFTGKAVVKNALDKGHTVYAVSRNGLFESDKNLININHDINDWIGLTEKVKDADVIISNFNGGWDNPNLYDDYLKGSYAVLNLAKKLNKHVLIVIGAGSLYDVKTGTQLYYGMPADFQKIVKGAFDLYHELKDNRDYKLTFVSPAVDLVDETATGDYNVGGDYVLYNNEGVSKISIHDLADLLVNSANKEHLFNRRITIANK